jgi:hypothetical protein
MMSLLLHINLLMCVFETWNVIIVLILICANFGTVVVMYIMYI